jgi:hypothetical protein
MCRFLAVLDRCRDLRHRALFCEMASATGSGCCLIFCRLVPFVDYVSGAACRGRWGGRCDHVVAREACLHGRDLFCLDCGRGRVHGFVVVRYHGWPCCVRVRWWLG